MIVDDDIFNLFAIQQLIETLGNFKIENAVNGEEAIAKVLAKSSLGESYSIILMDLNMPVMDGMKATRRLRKMATRTKIDL